MVQCNAINKPHKYIDLHITPILEVLTPEFLSFMRIFTKKAVLLINWQIIVVNTSLFMLEGIS